MKPAPFGYEAPETLDDAVRALSGDDAKLLAGGQSLIPILSLRLGRFSRLIDLRRIEELRSIASVNGGVRIGAMVTQSVAAAHPVVRAGVPLLPKATRHIGHFQIRNCGTIGGSIAHADPAAELPAVALALDATMELVGPGSRRLVPASDFFRSSYTTACDDDEILAAVTFPSWPTGAGFAIEEVVRRSGDFALVGAVCGVHVIDARIAWIAIGLFGVGSAPVRASGAEALFVGRPVAELGEPSLTEGGYIAMSNTEPPDDVHASAAYRRSVGAHVVARVVAAALKDATDA